MNGKRGLKACVLPCNIMVVRRLYLAFPRRLLCKPDVLFPYFPLYLFQLIICVILAGMSVNRQYKASVFSLLFSAP
ncbi:MAG: hypothetical protein LBD48_13155, partial [Treponema sp.]|nr:hypothetical protein [Treponema sp.]